MSAEPLHTASPWPEPPKAGYTVDDLYNLPDLPPHTELIDGSLAFVSPQRRFRSLAIDLLVGGLRRTVPEELRVRREMSVLLTRGTVPEPDVSVVRAEAEAHADHTQTRYEAKHVVLVVEVVSPDSVERDRDTKPHKYARAGIPHFWRVEMTGDEGHPVAHVYELDTTTMAYVVTGIHHNDLKLSVPFDIDIDLTEIDRL
jgi:Uma2 family endonuclease